MKKILLLILTLTISAALLIGCTASAQHMEAAEANAEPVLQPEIATLANEQGMSAASGDLCAACADTDCEGGESCNIADKQEEYRTCNMSCGVCGDDNCDGGAHCAGRDNRHNNHHSGHHGNHHHN